MIKMCNGDYITVDIGDKLEVLFFYFTVRDFREI